MKYINAMKFINIALSIVKNETESIRIYKSKQTKIAD